MNNQELELKLKELLAMPNFFDMIEMAIAFEKEYKTSSFFKKTKMPLMEVIKSGKAWYFMQFSELGNGIQSIISNLDLSNINNLLEQVGSMYETENESTLNIIREFKDIVK